MATFISCSAMAAEDQADSAASVLGTCAMFWQSQDDFQLILVLFGGWETSQSYDMNPSCYGMVVVFGRLDLI